ncbi:MAG: response regulator transcription factor [Actinobacteria bacterium]|nr:response regulator transcription factor [Actinomycetota bacterium]
MRQLSPRPRLDSLNISPTSNCNFLEVTPLTIKVFVVDDHELVRRGLIDLIDAEGDLDVVGQAGTVATALEEIIKDLPDVAVLDVRLPDGNGIELCREIRSLYPSTRVLMLTSFSDDEALLGAVMGGASGFVIKDIKNLDLLDAIRRIANGESLLDTATTTKLRSRLRESSNPAGGVENLTDQERRVLEFIGEGFTNRQIANSMFLAEKTVKNYVSSLLSKLGLERRTQAAALAVRLGLNRP